MFETKLVQWLQGFASPTVDWLLTGISQLGHTPVYAVLMMFLAFAVRLRPALALMLGMLLVGILTEEFKTSVAFPRPEHVFQLQATSTAPPETYEADGFWSFPSADTRAAVRATEGISYGFPSGHVSAATAFCFGVALFFRWRLAFVLAFIWPLLMCLSRMYLARHFLADVLGGLAVGGIAVASAAGLLHWIDQPHAPARQPRRLALLCVATLALAVLSLSTPFLDPEKIGRLAGLMAIYAVLTVKGFPVEAGGSWQWAGRFGVAMLLFVVIGFLVDRGLELAGWEDQPLPILIATAVVFGGAFLAAVAVCQRLRWYRHA